MNATFSCRLYRLGLRLYPYRFRCRHGAEMEALFIEARDQARRSSGIWRGFAFWLHAAWDLFRHCPQEHARTRRRSRLDRLDLHRERRAPAYRLYTEEAPMTMLIEDLRSAVRSLGKRPIFTLTVVAILAIGIGFNTAIYSLIDAVLLRPVRGVVSPQRVVSLTNNDRPRLSFADIADVREQTSEIFSAVAAASRIEVFLGLEGSTERLDGELVSVNYFSLLGVDTALGRALGPADENQPVVVLSHDLWRSRFGGDAGIMGDTVQLNGRGFLVVGVAPDGFHGTQIKAPPQLWVPLRHVDHFVPTLGSKVFAERGWAVFHPIARLAPGVPASQARLRLAAVGAALEGSHPNRFKARSLSLVSSRRSAFGLASRNDVRRLASLLAGAVALVLLICCLNVASLLAVRGSNRRREFAIRLALGSSRSRLVRQLLAESLLLALAGGLSGLILARWSFELLGRLELPGAVRPELALDPHAFLFCLFLSLSTGIAFGLLPALRGARLQLIPGLQSDARAGSRRLGSLLVVSQMTLSLVLLMGAGLLIRTLWNLSAVDPGFNRENLLTAALDIESQGYDEQRGRAFHSQLMARVKALGVVRSASLASELPMSGDGSSMGLYVEHEASGPHSDVSQSIVDVGFFDTLGILLIAGRDFTDQDREEAPWVVVVNETLARRFWPGANPIGQRIGVSGLDGPFYEVVGIVRDHRHQGLREEPTPHLYWAHQQLYSMMSGSAKTLVVRTEGEPLALAATLRSEVRALDPGLALYDVTTMSAHLAGSLGKESQTSVLFSSFATVALFLAAVGLYGVLAFSVTQRRHEIGIRMALGARPTDVLRAVIYSGLGLAIVGVVLGAIGLRVLERLLGGFLFGVEATDPLTFLLTAALLLTVAALASLVPARRAAKVDPIVALHYS